MRFPTLFAMVMILFSFMGHARECSDTYKVMITNLTKGQPITPPVVAIHSPGTSLFELGSPASPGLTKLAEDGETTDLMNELANKTYVVRTEQGSGIIAPGATQTIMVKAHNYRYRVAVFAMLARTNDAFLAIQNAPLSRQPSDHLASAYDAGSEMNTESCEHIPAPPCNNPGSRTEAGEGFIRPHEGISGQNDLIHTRDAFGNKVARIRILSAYPSCH